MIVGPSICELRSSPIVWLSTWQLWKNHVEITLKHGYVFFWIYIFSKLFFIFNTKVMNVHHFHHSSLKTFFSVPLHQFVYCFPQLNSYSIIFEFNSLEFELDSMEFEFPELNWNEFKFNHISWSGHGFHGCYN